MTIKTKTVLNALDPRERLARLTPREREVVRLRCHGLTNDGVSHRLAISPHTAKAHTQAAFEAMGVACMAEACYVLGRADERWELAMLHPRTADPALAKTG